MWHHVVRDRAQLERWGLFVVELVTVVAISSFWRRVPGATLAAAATLSSAAALAALDPKSEFQHELHLLWRRLSCLVLHKWPDLTHTS